MIKKGQKVFESSQMESIFDAAKFNENKHKIEIENTKKRYKNDLEHQMENRKLQKINTKKLKQLDLIEVAKTVKKEENVKRNSILEEREKRRKTKEMYDMQSELYKQRKLQERIEEINEDKRKVTDYHRPYVYDSSDSVYLNLVKGHNEKKQYQQEVFLQKLGMDHQTTINSLENASKKDQNLVHEKNRKIMYTGAEDQKKEYFKHISQKQLKNEINYNQKVKQDILERESKINKWIEKGIYEADLNSKRKNDEQIQKKENTTKLIRNSIEKQLIFKEQIKEKLKNEDKAFHKQLSIKIEKERQKEFEDKTKKKEKHEAYISELKSQNIIQDIRGFNYRKLSPGENKISKSLENLESNFVRFPTVDTQLIGKGNEGYQYQSSKQRFPQSTKNLSNYPQKNNNPNNFSESRFLYKDQSNLISAGSIISKKANVFHNSVTSMPFQNALLN